MPILQSYEKYRINHYLLNSCPPLASCGFYRGFFYLKRQATVPKPMPTADNTPKIRHFDFYTDEFHHYPVDIPQNCLDVIDKNIALNADNVFARIGDVQKTAILLFAEYIDAATTIAAQSGGGGDGATSGWGRDKDEDELSWAYRCAMMANRLCRPRKKQGYGR